MFFNFYEWLKLPLDKYFLQLVDLFMIFLNHILIIIAIKLFGAPSNSPYEYFFKKNTSYERINKDFEDYRRGSTYHPGLQQYFA